MKVVYKCSLCFKGETVEDYNKLINIDSLSLCENCYKRYNESEYMKKAMLCNSIRMYRRLIEKLQDDQELSFYLGSDNNDNS